MPLRPRHTFNAGFVLSGDKWDLGAEVHGVADRRDVGLFLTPPPFLLEDYTTTRIFGSYDLSDRLEIYGRVENLFNEEYVFTRGFEANGLGVYGGVRLILGK